MKDSALAPPLAVALTWDGEHAPRVVAKGAGHVAGCILALAREHDVPLQAEPGLVTLLSKVELGQEIPRALYLAVAQVLAFAWGLRAEAPPPSAVADEPDR
jgi:flagellar biosynthesis protein